MQQPGHLGVETPDEDMTVGRSLVPPRQLEGAVQSRDGRPSGNVRAGWSALLGVLSVVTMPLAILGTRYSSAYRLLDAGFAIPLGLVLGVSALALARSARRRDERALGRLGGVRSARGGRILGTAGVCLALTALISVAVYGLLQYIGSRN